VLVHECHVDLPFVAEHTVIGIDASLTGTGVFETVKGSNQGYTALFSSDQKGMSRVSEISRNLRAFVLDRSGLELTILEDYAFAKGDRAHQLGELGGMIRMMFWSDRLNATLISPSAVKKFLTGRGNTKKALLGKELYKKYGIDLDDDNEVDAAIIALAGHALLQLENNPEVDLPKYRKDVVSKLSRYETMPRPIRSRLQHVAPVVSGLKTDSVGST